MNFLRGFLLVSLVIYSSLINASHNDAIRSFWHPMYLGKRLAYCDTECCGMPVANKYCQMLGYDGAKKSVIAHNVGLTNFLTSRLRCVGWRCDGFLLIDCKKNYSRRPPKPYHYRERNFVSPRFNDYRVAWCYNKNSGCGRRAANSFCSHMGYLEAKSFIKEPCMAATKTMGSQELCFGPQCTAFKTILCYR